MSEYLGNNQPPRFNIQANESYEMSIGLFPPLENTWRLGILFHVNSLSDSVLIWSDSIKISE